MKCHLCSAVFYGPTIEADKLGWDWFTQWSPNRIETCPRCMADPEMKAKRDRNYYYWENKDNAPKRLA